MSKENKHDFSPNLAKNRLGTFSKIFEKVSNENFLTKSFKSTEPIPVESGILGLQVNSRLLHYVLKSGQQYSDWIKDRIQQCAFIEGFDFFINLRKNKPGRGRIATDYIVTIDVAKELAMLEFNEIGRVFRRYFIEIEKRYRDWIGFILPRLEMDFDLFGQRDGYNYIQLLRACGCSLESGRIRARIRKYRQEFWRNQAKDIYVSEKYGKTIITNAIARKLNTEAKERRLEYENQKALTEGGVL